MDAEGPLLPTAVPPASSSRGKGAVSAQTRREKNRKAAKKCRAKKNTLLQQIQDQHDQLFEQNQEMRRQQVSMACLFAEEERVRQALQVLAQALGG